MVGMSLNTSSDNVSDVNEVKSVQRRKLFNLPFHHRSILGTLRNVSRYLQKCLDWRNNKQLMFYDSLSSEKESMEFWIQSMENGDVSGASTTNCSRNLGNGYRYGKTIDTKKIKMLI